MHRILIRDGSQNILIFIIVGSKCNLTPNKLQFDPNVSIYPIQLFPLVKPEMAMQPHAMNWHVIKKKIHKKLNFSLAFSHFFFSRFFFPAFFFSAPIKT